MTHPAADLERVAVLVSELVAVPSIMLAEGERAPGPLYGEAAVAAVVARVLAEQGLAPVLDAVEPGRPLVRASVGSGPPELLLTAHLDTVPPVHWPTDPFAPVRRGTRLTGLGACDDKASVAAMLLAMGVLGHEGPLAGTVTFIALPGEETFGVGSRWLVRQGYRPDAAVVGEPTNLRVARVECGNVRWRIRARGRSVHGSHPWEGENALYRLGDVLCLLRDAVAPKVARLTHALAGRAAFNAGLVAGGRAVNIVPDEGLLTVERRVLPGEDPIQAMEAINGFLAERVGGLEFEPPLCVNHPVDTPAEHPLVSAFTGALTGVGLPAEPIGVSFGSDANRLAGAGVPCIVFGPGSITQAHTRDEWVDLTEVVQAAELLAIGARNYLSGGA